MVRMNDAVRAVLYSEGRKGLRVVIVKNKPAVKGTLSDGNYRLPGGAIEDGEGDINCLERELSQELGIEELLSISSRPIESYTYQNPGEDYRKKVRVYVARANEGAIDGMKMNKDELLGTATLGPLQAIRKLHYRMEQESMRKFYRLKAARSD